MIANRCSDIKIMEVKVLIFWFCVMLIDVPKFVESGDLQKWNNFKNKYNKHYATPKEEKRRMKIFEENLRKIAKHNKQFKKGKVTFKIGINKFADMTAKEFTKMHLPNITLSHSWSNIAGSQKDESIVTYLDPNRGTPPDFKNWVTEGAVTRVKHQSHRCGSCWAFVVAGAIESHNFIKTGKMVLLSEQNLLDCVGTVQNGMHSYTNDCDGGYIDFCLQYVIDNEGIETEKSYPYEGKKGSCRYKPKNRGAVIKDFKKSQPGDEELLKGIVGLIGPVTSTFAAEGDLMHLYTEGIYSNPTCGEYGKEFVNHAVLLVGYGTEANQPYWLVKNSWGPEWGEDGYFRVRRGNNECDMASENYYPVL